jgi:hypothetical protein
VRGSREREADDAGDDRAHGRDLPAPNALLEEPGGDREEHDEADREGRLDHREGGEEEGERLADPAGDDEDRAADPLRA